MINARTHSTVRPDADAEVPGGPVRVGFVLHVMQVAGAEMLVAETIRRLGARLQPTVLCLDGVGPLGEALRKEGVPVITLERRPGLDLSLPRRMARVIREHGLEVLHPHQYTPFFYTALARPFVRRPLHVILTEHGRHYPDVVSPRRRLVNQLLLTHFVDEITGVSRFSAESLVSVEGFRGHDITVIDNGIDPERYESRRDWQALRRELGLDPSRRYVACVARFHSVKDHATLIRGFAGVARAFPDVDLLLAGDGPLRADLERLVKELGVQDRVLFLGVRSDVPRLLQAVDIFAMTSLSEAASLTVLEAMASGRPVVVTAVGGNPELVRHEREGLLVPRGDAGATTEALRRLLEDSEMASRLGHAGQQRVREHFRLDDAVTKYYDHYAAAARRLRGITQ